MWDQFADWYRQAGIEPDAETLPKYRDAIEQYRPDGAEVIAFARIFFGFITDEDPSLVRFASALRTAVPTLSTGHMKQLMAVFSGAALASLLNRGDHPRLSDLSALVLVCGAVQGLRNALPVVEIPKIAARYIERRTHARTLVDSVAEGGGDDARVAALERELAIVGEETNILWWLFSGFSRDRNEPWATIGVNAAPVIAGKELADLTRVIPGPVSAAAFIDRVVSPLSSARTRTLKLKDAVDETPRQWREHQAQKQPACGLENLTPVSNGLRLSLTVSEGAEWCPVFEKGTRLPRDAKLRPAALAYQMYLECLLARLAAEDRKDS